MLNVAGENVAISGKFLIQITMPNAIWREIPKTNKNAALATEMHKLST